MELPKLARNIPLFYMYMSLNSFILDRGIWMLFLAFKGFTLAEIALIESAYHCVIFLLEIPTGYIADRYGRRTSLFLAQLAGIGSASFLLWGDQGYTIIIGFMLGALVGTLQSGATSAMIYETLLELGKEATYKKQNSILLAVGLVAMSLSGMTGGVLSDINWGWVYGGKIMLHLLTLGIVLLLFEPALHKDSSAAGKRTAFSLGHQIKEIYQYMRMDRTFISYSFYGAVLFSMAWSLTFYSQIIFQSIGLNNSTIGFLNGLETWIGAGFAAVAFIGEQFIGKRGSMLVSGLGFTLCLLAFSISGNSVVLISAFFLMSMFISYIEPLLEAYLNELLPSNIRATMLSVFGMMISSGMMITFTTIGFLADAASLPIALQKWILVWIPLFAVVCLLAMKRAGSLPGK
ncbi:MFS transporter [Paenibacillus psychroresistens]|uniref:MFS transporter n=1 Tax=Paenibacillus psychroresistens TaxID=1778678 RepID=A0A6B8RRA5_9BACL|nr:MFS transporter [Paenibacillus psychroresistens]QGQ98920.1 MFS transporter [Paenibacillus psychroresistens]